MLLKLIKYATLLLVMLNIPGWVLAKISPIYSSFLSYLSFGLMLFYFVLARKWKFNVWMLLLGILYFGISSLSDQRFIPYEFPYLILVIKYFIIVIGGYIVVCDTTKDELFLFLVLGAFSVFLQIFFFYDPLTDGARYSGFYLNPNSLGFICMMGYALTYSLQKKWRLLGQIIFTLIGLLTFSRTFLIVWLLINLLSIRLSIKNIRIIIIGVALLVGIVTFKSLLPKTDARLEALTNIFEGKSKNTSKLEEGGRSETWAYFYPYILSKPIFGNGYGSFGGEGIAGSVGAHNSFLKVIGEAGIFCFIIFVSMFFNLLLKSYSVFLNRPHLFLMSMALSLFLLTNHNFFDTDYLLFFTMWLLYQLKTSEANEDQINPKSNLNISS